MCVCVSYDILIKYATKRPDGPARNLRLARRRGAFRHGLVLETSGAPGRGGAGSVHRTKKNVKNGDVIRKIFGKAGDQIKISAKWGSNCKPRSDWIGQWGS